MHPPATAHLTDAITLRSLRADDAAALAAYFDGLSAETTRRFQPHPLTRAMALTLCASLPSPTVRLVLEHRSRMIIGYFILDPVPLVDDAARYAAQGVPLEPGRDWMFAPSVADDWQDQGLATLAMPHLLAIARTGGARSLVLMGGTQATNARAIRFYEKVGFLRCGGYQTEVWNHDMRLPLDP